MTCSRLGDSLRFGENVTDRTDRAPSSADLAVLLAAIGAEADYVVRANRITADLVPMLARFDDAAVDTVIDGICTDHKWAGSKTSLGRSVRRLVAAARPKTDWHESEYSDLKPGYLVKNGRLCWVTSSREGPKLVPIANFEAYIVEQVYGDDGSEEPVVTYHVEGRLHDGRLLPPIVVMNRQFDSMSWVNDWGAEPRVAAGPGMRDHARVAIRDCSAQPLPTRHRYRHIGWRRIGEQWVYLHAGGAIGASGAVSGVEVELAGAFRRYELPEPPTGDVLINAIRASIQMLAVAPLPVIAPVYAAMTRAPLGMTDFSVFVAGDSGLGKTELASLAQRHWGATMDRLNVPASWQSTANSLEVSAFIPKDALFVVDDFAPTGGRNDYERWVKDADRFFRAVGNQAGRGRLKPDGQAQVTKYPRCLPLATGEDIPHGLSSMASRVLWIEIGRDDVDWKRLTACQEHASGGLYAQAMSGYLQWLAANRDAVFGSIETKRNLLAAELADKCNHKRTPRIAADLLVGLSAWLRYATESGAVTASEADMVFDECATALLEVAQNQSRQQTTRAPARRFIDAVKAALAAGRAHISTPRGDPPKDIASACGWKLRQADTPREEWIAQGACVGWLDGEYLWLNRDTSYSVALEQGRGQNDALAVSKITLGKRLDESKMLAWKDEARGCSYTRRTFGGSQQEVWCLSPATLFGETPDTAFMGPNPGNLDLETDKTAKDCQGNTSINLNSLVSKWQFCQFIPQLIPPRDAGIGAHVVQRAQYRAHHAHHDPYPAGKTDKTAKSAGSVGTINEIRWQVEKVETDKTAKPLREPFEDEEDLPPAATTGKAALFAAPVSPEEDLP